ncbi:cationic amino acid transporter 1-like [Amaranthus tricolor]|uniref:cationic amino acid transporter 1-like n=1 Tax=Amaranthus tricolor TaxID=29722 RepID=UPI0025872AC5|nr:cationic amino acid transporter 1-like [Amaranthus tricolor]
MRALKEIPKRLINRIVSRSQDEYELHEVKERSQYEMMKILEGWDLIWFGVGSLIGAGIFVLTGIQAKRHAGPAVVLSFLVAGSSAMLSLLCYVEFAVEIPVAGGSFAYIKVELGEFVAFIAAGNILMEYILSGAALARAWTSYFATLCDYTPDEFRVLAPNLSKNYNHLDPIAVVVIAVVCVLAVTSTKVSSRVNVFASIIHMGVIIFIIIFGLTKANISNYKPFIPYGFEGVFRASAVLFFAFVGFDAISTMAEETKNPAQDIPFGLIGSMVIAIISYCFLAITLCLMQPYFELDSDAPFSVAFRNAGFGWAKYVVDMGALKGMITVLLVNAIGQARYLTHIARTHMLPPWFAQVNKSFGTPVNATVVMLLITAIIALFTDLIVLSNLLSISTLLIFLMVPVALLVRRYYRANETTYTNLITLLFCIAFIFCSAIANVVLWNRKDSNWKGYIVTLSIWFISTLGLKVFVPQARYPKAWGVPFMPWVASASIFINIFLLGSIDKDSFVRFGIWTIILIVYYLLFGLHASYDISKAMEEKQAQDVHNITIIEQVDYHS